MSSNNKIALVTGSSRGIGKAIALDLARHGLDIVVNYRSKATAAKEAVKLIRDMGSDAEPIKADVASEAQVKSMVDRALRKFGGIDILVNGAAIHRGGRIEKIDPEDWYLVVNSVLRGAFNCCRYIVPLMVERGWGRIINISSIAGIHGHPGDTAYGSAKAGLIGFTKSLAKEVAKKGVTANVVIPGYVQTDMTSVLFDTEQKIRKLIQRIPMGRPGMALEIAEAVTFLAVKGAYVTGAVIRVDGGMGM